MGMIAEFAKKTVAEAAGTAAQTGRLTTELTSEETTTGQTSEETTIGKWATRKDVAQTVQGWVTAIGILAGGGWAYYTFIVGRQFSGSPEIQIQHKHTLKRQNGNAAVVSVKVKNVGFTALEKERATISILPITEAQLGARLPRMQILPASLDPRISLMALPGDPGEFPKERELFHVPVNLEPGAGAGEEVLLPFGEHRTMKVEVSFTGNIYLALPRRELRTWTARIILDRDAERKTEGGQADGNTAG
jgi:hypothetical protein